ncbi:SMP-30/Gluconolaconase/LRE-like region-containing protein [Maribacter aquivivus]|uniref:SMP-30/Gluconolaconase/LRE-like region-containing protein n=1 Tax=Maribacter aquivivus TaxID=228958 RepID=A0A1M6Q7W2_9FLAO|nr:SMP-30/gluconolactonase/LRE family protein [Maribacter aquivivus]SHK16374.1 SMP-30/Gluconolaconase/LRE-like region-containing protein [Maribacter aquivivus]
MVTKLIAFIIAFTFALICNAQSEIEFPIEVGMKPESITKGFQDNYYVTLMNAKESGDGELVEISKNGVKVFAKGFDEPKGIVYLNGYLYFSDVTRIWRVDKEGKASIFVDKADFHETVLYLNDVSLDKNGNGMYIADMGATQYMRDTNNNLWPLDSEEAKKVPELGRIYHVDLDGHISIKQDTSPLMLNPNGVGVDNDGNIMVASFFNGNFLVTKNGVLSPLKGLFRGADAVEQDSKGNYYVSSWVTGKVWKIDPKTEASTVLIEGLESAADFYLEEEKDRLLVPDMMAGKIYSVPLKN